MKICDLWLNHGKGQTELGRMFGLDAGTIDVIIDNAGLRGASRAKDTSRKFSDQKPISSLHAQIGHDINRFRTFTAKESVSQFALRLNMSSLRLRKIELGIDELKLSELTHVTQVLGTTMDKLTTLRNGSNVR